MTARDQYEKETGQRAYVMMEVTPFTAWLEARVSLPVVEHAERLLAVAIMAKESQGWSGNDPDETRWVEFYKAAREAVAALHAALAEKK